MFDVGFSELVVIGIVALVVIGPERLPKVARMAGLLLGRMQRYVNDIKADINREIELDELKKLRNEVQDTARNLEASVRSEMTAVETAVSQQVQSTQAALNDSAATAEASTPAASAPTPPLSAGAANADTAQATQQPVAKT